MLYLQGKLHMVGFAIQWSKCCILQQCMGRNNTLKCKEVTILVLFPKITNSLTIIMLTYICACLHFSHLHRLYRFANQIHISLLLTSHEVHKTISNKF